MYNYQFAGLQALPEAQLPLWQDPTAGSAGGSSAAGGAAGPSLGLAAGAQGAGAAPTAAAQPAPAGQPEEAWARWIVVASDELRHVVERYCAQTEVGKRHCKYVAEHLPFSVFHGPEAALVELLESCSGAVRFVEPDILSKALGTPRGLHEYTAAWGTNRANDLWGLDRIDSRVGLSQEYTPAISDGYATGVHVYVLDTGIRTTHQEFEGRAVPTLQVGSDGPVECLASDTSCALDVNGHGSHCAGIIGGKTFGVAKNVTLHAVQVLGRDGIGMMSWNYMAMDWVIKNHQKPAVMSMSLGTRGRPVLASFFVDAAVDHNVTVVTAAGNDAFDACFTSPSYAPRAITVGATDIPAGDALADHIAAYSNQGSCVDIFAPGTDILSVGVANDAAQRVMSGTSMACPAVAGAAALLLEENPDRTPEQLSSTLKARATTGTLKNIVSGTPDLLLYVGPLEGGNGDRNATSAVMPGTGGLLANAQERLWLHEAAPAMAVLLSAASLLLLVLLLQARGGGAWGSASCFGVRGGPVELPPALG